MRYCESAIDVYAVGEVPKHAAKLKNTIICTSKMQVQNKLRHHRQELEYNRPKASYGMIYGYFSTHPGNNDPKIPEPDHPNNQPLPTSLPVGHPEGRPLITLINPQPPTTLHPLPVTADPGPATSHPSPTSTHPAPVIHPAP